MTFLWFIRNNWENSKNKSDTNKNVRKNWLLATIYRDDEG